MRKRLTMRLAALLFALVLVSTLVMIVPAAGGSNHSDQSDSIISLLEQLAGDVSNTTELPFEAFEHKNEGSVEGKRGALVNKIGAVINKIKSGAYDGAVKKLKNDIQKHIIKWLEGPWENALFERVNEIIELIEEILPPNLPPVADFTESAETVLTGEVINFNASESYDPDGSIVRYFWDFGDGTNATGMIIVAHAYADDGVYTVALTVTDDDGATDTATSTKTVMNRPPVAVFTESAESVPTGEIIYFNASDSHDPDGSIVSHFWDFGDGNNATGVTADHTYAEDGTYTVTLTVTDDDGATASVNATKIAGNRPPVAEFTESAEMVLTSVAINFDASGSDDPDGYIASYFWDFGDGNNATGVTADHAYTDDGIYIVALRVTDNDGATATATSTKIVLNRPPVASFTENATTVLTGEVIHFDASGSDDPDGSIVSYVWDFGDGTDATGVTVTHAYTDDGVYTVTLTVTDDDDATASKGATKMVSNRPPFASFTENATTVKNDEVIHFDASDSYDPDGYIASYFWDFGDGTNATGVTADHAYAEDGNYTVTLTVTDDDGASSSVSAMKTVEARAAGWPLALLAAIGLGIAALTATLLYALYRRRKRRRSSANPGNKPKPVVTLYVPAKILSRFELKPLKRRKD